MNRPKKQVVDQSSKITNQPEQIVEEVPRINSITISPTGTIFGVYEGILYVYDDFTKKWRKL